MLIIEAVPLLITERLYASVIMATSSTPWMNHNGEELIDQGILRKKKPGILLSRTPVWGNKWLWLFSAETRPLESGFYKAANPCWESSHWEGKLRYRRSHWVGDILMLTWGWGQANQRGEKGDSSVQMGAQTHESTRLFHKDHGEKSPMILSCFPSFLSQIDF